jgi:hypothetical protein
LNLRLAPANHRREEYTSGQKGSGNPEDSQLQMPCAREIERKNPSQIHAKKIRDLRAVMLRGGADQGLEQKQSGHYKEKPAAHALGRSQSYHSRRAKR